MARRLRQPLGRQYAYPPRAVPLSQTRARSSDVLQQSVLARHDGPESLELRLSSLEDKVDKLTSLVESKLGRLTGEPGGAAQIASAPAAEAPLETSTAAASCDQQAGGPPPGSAMTTLHPWASQPE